MTSEEVVVGHEEDGQGNSAIEVLEAATGAGVELIGAVKPFDDLFELAVFSTFGVLISQADDGASFKREGGALEQSGVVDCMGRGVIGRVAVADEFGSGAFGCGSDGFRESDERMLSAPGIGEVIGMDGAADGADSEPGVIPPIGHAGIGFIAGNTRVDRAFVMHVELMTKHGSGIGVVQDSLMGYRSLKDVFKHVSSHSRTKSI